MSRLFYCALVGAGWAVIAQIPFDGMTMMFSVLGGIHAGEIVGRWLAERAVRRAEGEERP